MRNLLLILTVICSSLSFGQILKNTNLNLNTGGVIHDVVYEPYYNAYVVVGNFTSINGQARTNLAFIDVNTLAVLPQAPISSIDGAIRSVEVYNYSYIHPTLGFSQRSYMYLGGNFSTINGQAHTYIARFSATHVYGQPPVGGVANFNLNTWDAELISTGFANSGVQDLYLSNDTLIAAGGFSSFSPPSYGTSAYKNILGINASAPSFTLQPIFTSFAQSGSTSTTILGVERLDNRLYLYGTHGAASEFINEHDLSGNFLQQIESCGTEQTVWDFEPHPTSIDTLLFSYENYSSSDGFTSYLLDGTLWHCQAGGSAGNSMINISSTGIGSGGFFEVYKNYIYNTNSSASNNGLYTNKRNGTNTVPILSTIPLNANWSSPYSLDGNPCVKREKDLLFLSGSNLTTVGGTGRTGLAIFCLEPRDAEPYTSFDSTACEGESSFYTVPQAEFADGYRWTYTGTGAMYRTVGSSTWLPLSTEILSGTNMNSIEISFPIGTTGGTLSVEPYSVCNTTTDYQFAQGQSGTISINPKPDVSLPAVQTLNCYSDTTILVAQTTNPNPSFEWSFNGGTLSNDSLLITINDPILLDSVYYVMEIIDTITGCANSDSTFFYQDLVATPLDPNLTTTNPSEWNCLTDSMTLTSNQTGYTIEWENPANPGIFYADPFTIYTAPSGPFNIHGIQLSNGCSVQASYGGIVVNQETATPVLVGHPNFVTELIDDSLNCATPTLSLQCDVDPAYSGVATSEWYYQGVPLGSNILNLTEADSAGMSGNIKIYTIVTTHSVSQCVDSAQIIVKFDFEPPIVPQLVDQSMNCSQSEVVLTHPTNGLPSVTEGWLDGTGTQTSSDTITASSVGDYYYEVQSTINGCSNFDTVTVIQTLDLLLDMPVDTLICPDQTVTISPIIIGNTETPTYLWSTGSTSSSETATGGIDSELIVSVSTPSGCSGSDTTTISITLPVNVTVTPFVGCTDGSLEMTVTTGGAGNYQYSLNGTTWQTTTNFPALTFGTYTVFVQDALGCIYDTTAQLDGTASTIDMLFAASTYNEEGDTIVLVNITDFTGLDSIAWNLPPTANVTYQDDSIVILSISDGGWHDIELLGYLGSNCTYSYISPVYFGDFVPVFDTSYAVNGIVNYDVYPNPLYLTTSNIITVDVEFGTTQNYTILVTNSLGQPIPSMSISGVGDIVSHQLTFPLGTAAGTYRVHIIADYDAKQQQITLF